MLLNLFLRALAWLPFAVIQCLGIALGWLMGLLPSKRNQRIDMNLQACLPELSETERRHLARKARINIGRNLLEAVKLWFGPEGDVRRLLLQVENRELLDQARAEAAKRNTGVLILLPHMNWEAGALFLATLGPTTGMYKPQPAAIIDRVIKAGRGRFGTCMVPATANAARQLLLRLIEGDMVLILPDQDPPEGRGVFAPFFNVPTHTSSFVGGLAKRTAAPVLLLQAQRLGLGKGYKIAFLPAPAGIDHPDKIVSATAINAGMETCIRNLPEEYMWNVQRFRRRPPGEKRIYRYRRH